MPQHHDLSRSLLTLDQTSTLIAVIEMSQASWLVAAIVPGIDRHPLKEITPTRRTSWRFCAVGRPKRPKRGRRSRASLSPSKPVATAFGLHAGCGRATSKPM